MMLRAMYDACIGWFTNHGPVPNIRVVLLRVQVANSILLFFFLLLAGSVDNGPSDGRNLLLLILGGIASLGGCVLSSHVRRLTRNIAIARITVHRRPTTRARGAGGL